MTLQSAITGAVTALRGILPERSVQVYSDGVAGVALKGAKRTDAELAMEGERGLTTSRIYMSQATWPESPKRGATIKVAGADCIVTGIPWGSEGLWIVEYQETRPVAG